MYSGNGQDEMVSQVSRKSTSLSARSEDWDSFRYFLAVARTRTISAAARSIGTSQPTVSRRVQELEQRLGMRLLNRSVSGISLTSAGRQVIERVERIELETLGMLDTQEANEQDTIRGRLRLAAPEGIGRILLPPLITEFRAQYPNIDIELFLGTPKMNLLNRDADVAIRVGDPGQDTLVGRNVGAVGFGLYVAANTDFGNIGKPSDLETMPIVDGAGGLAQSVQVKVLASLAPHAHRVFRSDSVLAQLDAVLQGVGVAALPRYVAESRNDLMEILPGAIVQTAKLWVLTHADLRQISRVRVGTQFFGRALSCLFRENPE